MRAPAWERAAAMARALHRRGVLAKLRPLGRSGGRQRLPATRARAVFRTTAAAAPPALGHQRDALSTASISAGTSIGFVR